MQNEPKMSNADDRREAPRADVGRRYSTRIDAGDGRAPIECVLLDYSVTGLRLEVPEDIALPQNIQVMIGSLAHNARIVWRRGGMVGVDFVDEHHSIY